MKKVTLGILILALSSCVSVGGKNQTPFPTETILSPTIPSIKPVATLAVPNYELAEPSPTATLEPFPSSYDLPVWMKASDTTIAAAILTDDVKRTRKIAFFNAATGESYEILMNRSTSGFFWYDNQNFGILVNDLDTVYRLNLTSGNVFIEGISPLSTRLIESDWISGYFNGLKVLGNPGSNQEIIFTSSWELSVSKNGTFTVKEKVDEDGFIITNNVTNESLMEFTSPADTYITTYEWSPVNDNLLAFVQGKYDSQFQFITENMTLNILDVQTGKLLKEYSGDFGWLSWSPDGEKILYENAKSRYHNYGIGFTEAPCTMFLNMDEQRCLNAIPRFVPQGYKLATTTQYIWSSDGGRIFYTALYLKDQEKYSIRGNFCIYDLTNGHIVCPTEKLDDLNEQGVSYSVSPNEEYVYLCMSKSTALNDYVDESKDGIMRLDGSGFFGWQGTIQKPVFNLCSYDVLWRPLP
jgi:hypothetical protein